MTTADTTAPESHTFEADVARLLHLMVHSVYSDKDVFLRELISNAADACEKLRCSIPTATVAALWVHRARTGVSCTRPSAQLRLLVRGTH